MQSQIMREIRKKENMVGMMIAEKEYLKIVKTIYNYTY